MFVALLLWLILFLFCWPLAVLALILYPILWLILLPLRLLGFVVGGILSFVWSVVTLPARLLRSKPGASSGGTLDVQKH